jgi:hypothetical protein
MMFDATRVAAVIRIVSPKPLRLGGSSVPGRLPASAGWGTSLAPIIRNLAILAAALTLGSGAATANNSTAAIAPHAARVKSEAPAGAAEVAEEPTGEFEGRYRVGGATCTVKPIKMAFELRWTKGKGAMRFFFDGVSAEGNPRFVSKDRGRGQDRFEFDDGNYNSGRFIRADGKVLTVQRLP